MSRIAKLERELRGQTICQAILVGGLALLALQLLRPVLLPFVLAIFIVSGLTPVLSGIESRFSTTRLVAVVIASILGLGLVVLLWSILWVSIAQLADDSEKYQERFTEMYTYVETKLDQTSDWFQSYVAPGSSNEETTDASQVSGNEVETTENSGSQQADRANGKLRSNPIKNKIGEMLRSWSDSILRQIQEATVELITSGTMVVIFVFFLLLGSSQAIPENETWEQIDGKIREYIVTKTLISFFTGIIFAFSLWIFGIPLAIVFGLMAFLFNFIPNIGPILACLLPLPLIILNPELNIFEMFLAITLSSTVQIVSGNVVEPRMMGDSFDVHPIAILLALMFWGLIWGIVGMFLAVPMTAIMKILFAKFEMTRPLADLLAGRIDGVSFKNFYFGEGDEKEAAKKAATPAKAKGSSPATGEAGE